MKRIASSILVFLVIVLFSSTGMAQEGYKNVQFDDWFTQSTMRIDYFHTGNATEELFALDQVLNDGDWAGSKTVVIDDLKLGPYFFEVNDIETNTLLYSRGYASIFGEWQTIPEAKKRWRTFHESVRFPWPLKPVVLTIKKRNADNEFVKVWSSTIDPGYRQVVKKAAQHNEKVFDIHNSTSSDKALDIVILGDGYTNKEMKKFKSDAKRLTEALLNAAPYNSNRSNINVRAVGTPAIQSGVSKPHHNLYRNSPLEVQYSAFDSERYALTYANKKVRDVAATVPYDVMIILMNERTYGGGGIYNLYATVAADNVFSDYIMVHELGHSIAALADEYYTSSVAYEMNEVTKEPWETNITALLDSEHLKWNDLVDATTPLPTPWNKEAFDQFGYENQKRRDSLRALPATEEVMEAFFKEQLRVEDELFSNETYNNQVGAFEGGGYMAKGIYRSQVDCIMFTRHMHFCKVCQHSIQDVIDQYTR